MFACLFYKLRLTLLSFIKGREGVTAVEYAVVAVTLVAVIAVVFNPSSGAFYDTMMQAKDSLVAAITDNT